MLPSGIGPAHIVSLDPFLTNIPLEHFFAGREVTASAPQEAHNRKKEDIAKARVNHTEVYIEDLFKYL